MSRHRFRSQPTLQRSGGGTTSALLGLLIVAVIGVGGGALVGKLLQGVEAGSPGAATVARVERLAPAPVRPPAFAAPAPAQSQFAALENPEAQFAAAPRPVRTATVARTRPLKTSRPLLADFGAAKPAWEAQQHDYEVARAAYDANEKAEGYRWAQQNRLRATRYCRATEQQRTPAFMEGCLSFVAPKPRASAGASSGDPG